MTGWTQNKPTASVYWGFLFREALINSSKQLPNLKILRNFSETNSLISPTHGPEVYTCMRSNYARLYSRRGIHTSTMIAEIDRNTYNSLSGTETHAMLVMDDSQHLHISTCCVHDWTSFNNQWLDHDNDCVYTKLKENKKQDRCEWEWSLINSSLKFSHARNYAAQAGALRSRFIDLDYHIMAPQ